MELMYTFHLNQILEPLRLGGWQDPKIYTDIPSAAITPLHVWVRGRGIGVGWGADIECGFDRLTLKCYCHLWHSHQSPRFTGLWRYTPHLVPACKRVTYQEVRWAHTHTTAHAHNLLIYRRSMEASASGTKTVLVLGSVGTFPKHFCLSDHICKSQPIGVFAGIG